MKHIVQFSGGKDSTCMLLMMLEKGMQVDEIIFCDTGMEFPGMYQHIEEVRQYIKPYGKDITILKAEHEYEWYMFHKPLLRGKNKGQHGEGWPTMKNRWCTRALKIEPTQNYLKQYGGDTVTYIGIASDEPKRHFESSTIKHPLFEWGISEKKALSYCKEHGFTWGGTLREVSPGILLVLSAAKFGQFADSVSRLSGIMGEVERHGQTGNRQSQKGIQNRHPVSQRVWHKRDRGTVQA